MSSFYNFPLLSSKLSSYFIIVVKGISLDHLPGPHLAKGLEYFLVFTFRETTHISVGLSYMVTTLTSIILSTSDVFFFWHQLIFQVLNHKQECTYSSSFLAGPGAIMVGEEL